MRIPGAVAREIRDDVAHHSDLMSPRIPRRFRPPFRDDVARLAAPLLARLGSAPLAFCMGERMPAERTTMRQVREVLRLTTAGVGLNEIARRVGVAPSTVRLTLKRLASAGLRWPLPAEMTDSALETALFAAAGTKQGHRRHAEPDWAEIHRELKRKDVTLTMLWDEYIEGCPEGYRYSRFCELYRNWAVNQRGSGTRDQRPITTHTVG